MSPLSHSLPLQKQRNKLFIACLSILGGSYLLIILLMLFANLTVTFQLWNHAGEDGKSAGIWSALTSPEIRYATMLSLLSSTLTAILSLWVAVPLAYLLTRFEFPGKAVAEALLDLPIILPPLVIGLFLLMLFNFPPFSWVSGWVVYEIPGIVLAQFLVACAFATRSMRVTFEQIPTRFEDVALTLGASRAQAFFRIVLPQAGRGILAAGTLAWARSLGEFGPILVFAGSTRMKTEVLPTSIFLEMQAGNLEGMLAVSLIMILCAVAVLFLVRKWGVKVVP